MPETYVSPTSGSDVTLTIDLDIQLSLENELMNAYKKYDAEGAIGIVMNPKSGEILAISSIPSLIRQTIKIIVVKLLIEI